MSNTKLRDKLLPITKEEIEESGIYGRWLPISALAKQRGVSKVTILNMIRRGAVIAKTFYGLILVDIDSL